MGLVKTSAVKQDICFCFLLLNKDVKTLRGKYLRTGHNLMYRE